MLSYEANMKKYKNKEQLEPKILNDVSKTAFVLPQILMETIQMWPLQQNWFTIMTFFIKLALMVLLELGQLIYFAINLNDIAKLTSTMSTLSTTLQAIVKMCILFWFSKEIKVVINLAYYNFWPSNFAGAELQKSLQSTTKLVKTSMACLSVSAVIFAFGFLTKPLIEGSMMFPFESWYPFNWQISPVYEIIYVLQVITNIYVVIISILGHDFFFLALCCNVIAQYKLLKKVMWKIGSGEDGALNKILINFDGVAQTKLQGEDSEEKMLLIKCILHHNLLLKVSTDMKTIFKFSLFVQLAASVTAICVSGFLITVMEIDGSQLYHLSSYCLGHVLQLFMICAAGNELSYQSQTLGDYAFNGDWHLKKYADIKKSLVLVILRCQKGSTLTAFDIFDLDYNCFVTVMRLSFSFYTLLSTIVEKKA